MAILRKKTVDFSLFLLCAFLSVLTVTGQNDTDTAGCPNLKPECRWEVRLQTGNSVQAGNPYGVGMDILVDPDLHFPIFDLRAKVITPKTNYFGIAKLATFRFDGPCVPDFCRVSFHNLGRGAGAAWYLASAVVKMTPKSGGGGPRERNQLVNRWLSQSYEPHSLSVTIDFCNQAIIQNAKNN